MLSKSVFLFCSLLFSSALSAQYKLVEDKFDFFSLCDPDSIMREDFTNSQGFIDEIFDGLIVFEENNVKAFSSSTWQYRCKSEGVQGRAVIAEPRFEGSSIKMEFSRPIYGFGANPYDDHDGNPFVNDITLILTASNGTKVSITESCDDIGDVGFLGGVSEVGFVSAEFVIDNTDGNLEVDNFTVCAQKVKNTSVVNLVNQIDFKSFPNPVADKLYVQSDIEDIRSLELYSIDGVLRYAKYNLDKKHFEVNMQDYNSALYYLRVTLKNNEKVVQKVFKK